MHVLDIGLPWVIEQAQRAMQYKLCVLFQIDKRTGLRGQHAHALFTELEHSVLSDTQGSIGDKPHALPPTRFNFSALIRKRSSRWHYQFKPKIHTNSAIVDDAQNMPLVGLSIDQTAAQSSKGLK